jgi:hypothetical protein
MEYLEENLGKNDEARVAAHLAAIREAVPDEDLAERALKLAAEVINPENEIHFVNLDIVMSTMARVGHRISKDELSWLNGLIGQANLAQHRHNYGV